MDRGRASRALAGGVLAMVLTACSGGTTQDAAPPGSPAASTSSSPTSPSSPPTPGSGTAGPRVEAAPPKPPRSGACYRLTLAGATKPTDSSRPVSCRGPHAALTFFVGRLDLSVDGRRLSLGSPRVQRQPRQACPARLRTFLGGEREARRLSRFTAIWFTPTLAQAQRGAAWFRCDVVVLGDEERLLRLPRDRRLRGALGRSDTLRRYGLCGTAAPGTDRFRRVACGLPHRWVAVRTLDLPGRAYPGVSRVRAADDECADVVRERFGEALRFRYGWEWPTARQWRSGQRYGICWAPRTA